MNTRQATRPATRSGCAETSRRAPPEFSYHSISFNGVDQYVDCGNSSTLNPADITIAMWIKPNALTNYDYLFTRGQADYVEAFRFEVGATDLYAAFGNGTSNSDISRAHGMSNGNWYHVAVTYDGSTAALYVNGSRLGATEAISIVMETAARTTTIGQPLTGAGAYFDGEIDEVATWDVALDADAVAAVYNSGSPNNLNQDNGDYTNSGDLQGWWRMGEGNDPGYYLISDASGNGNDGTTQNEPAWSNDTPQRWPQNFSYYGLDFNGVDQYVDCGDNVLFDSASAFSLSGWVKITDYSPAYPSLICVKTDQSTGFHIGFSSVSAYEGIWFGSSSNFLRQTTDDAVLAATMIDGNWHHIALTFDGADRTADSSYTLYVDGSAETHTSAASFTTVPNVNKIGGAVGGTEMDGSIDEVAVWDSALDADAVAAVYNGGVPAALTSLSPTAWYRMGEGNTVDGALVTDLAATDSNALYLPGVASNYASVPDAADLDGFGDFTFEAKGVTFADWTTPSTAQGLMSKYKTSTNERAWRLDLQTDGKLYLVLSFLGTDSTGYTSSEATGVTDGATADIMVMRTGEDIRFYVDGVQLGTDQTCVTTALHNSTENVVIGASYNTTGLPMTGSMERARIWNSAVANQATPTETPVLDANFTLANKGVTSFTATSGQTVTVNTTSIADPAVIRQATDGVNVNSPAWTKNTPS